MKEYRNPDQILESIRTGQYQRKQVVDPDMGSIVPRRRKSEDQNLSMDEVIAQYIEEIEASEPAVKKEDKPIRPRGREDFYADTGLTEDPAFMKELERLQDKYPGLTKSEVFRVIQGESGFNPKARNKNSKASGLFQFIPDAAADLGFTVDEIIEMEPTEQLRLYDQYLERWNYEGGNSLGIMQAAPAYANAAPDEVIYARGSKAWEQNPGWRESGDGDITVASINRYYRNQ